MRCSSLWLSFLLWNHKAVVLQSTLLNFHADFILGSTVPVTGGVVQEVCPYSGITYMCLYMCVVQEVCPYSDIYMEREKKSCFLSLSLPLSAPIPAFSLSLSLYPFPLALPPLSLSLIETRSVHSVIVLYSLL